MKQQNKVGVKGWNAIGWLYEHPQIDTRRLDTSVIFDLIHRFQVVVDNDFKFEMLMNKHLGTFYEYISSCRLNKNRNTNETLQILEALNVHFLMSFILNTTAECDLIKAIYQTGAKKKEFILGSISKHAHTKHTQSLNLPCVIVCVMIPDSHTHFSLEELQSDPDYQWKNQIPKKPMWFGESSRKKKIKEDWISFM